LITFPVTPLPPTPTPLYLVTRQFRVLTTAWWVHRSGLLVLVRIPQEENEIEPIIAS